MGNLFELQDTLTQVHCNEIIILSRKFRNFRVYTPVWLWYWSWVQNVLQRLAWGKKIPASRYSYTANWSEDKGDVWASRSLELYSRRRRERELGAALSEIGQKTCGKPEGLCYGTCRWGHVWVEGLHVQKSGWALGVKWIAGRRRWSRYGESPWRRNCGREDNGVGLPRKALRAVAVPGEFL